MSDPSMPRRELLLAPLLAALPMALIGAAQASPLDPSQTIVVPEEKLVWETAPDWPVHSVAQAKLFGDITEQGIYYRLVKWYPGYMSAPHTYVTDRLCVVVSGTWWVNSGADFDPARCIPAPAGTFVRRVALTPHYDGVIASGPEPAVIAICGIGPVGQKWLDPSQPGWRKV
jgi:hypothetical protein